MAEPTRTPPRFVPTLTAVVDEPLPLSEEAVPPASSPVPDADQDAFTFEDAIESSPVPLVELHEPVAAPIVPTAAQMALPPSAEAVAFRLEEELLHRVLQRIDLSLEERLTDTVSAAVQQQLDVMLPRLRGEIEQVLRALVVEALSLELSESTGSAPASDAPPLG